VLSAAVLVIVIEVSIATIRRNIAFIAASSWTLMQREAIDRVHDDEVPQLIVAFQRTERHIRWRGDKHRVVHGRRIAQSSRLVPITSTSTVAARLRTSTTVHRQNSLLSSNPRGNGSFSALPSVGRCGGKASYQVVSKCLSIVAGRVGGSRLRSLHGNRSLAPLRGTA